MELLERIGRLFYIISPNNTSFETLRQVPDYIERAKPDLVLLFLLEICVSKCLKRSNLRVNDTITCLSQGILLELSGLILPGVKVGTFFYIHSNWKIVDLPWNSPLTWWICFFGVDFLYYWFHRAAHEINLLWATHQVHHSSEDYNISTNVRQSILQNLGLAAFYLPIVSIIPPTVFLVHLQFMHLYQYWIHTEIIKSLGPLEYILNTPNHHRVHHGANRNYIDKNFGGTLIIWDRLFGTFAASEEKVVYGLTHQIPTFEPMRIQFDHCIHMWRKFQDCKGWKNKLCVIFKGPGWTPGKPWHGDIQDVPNVEERVEKYNPEMPTWCKVYAVCHFLILIQLYIALKKNFKFLKTHTSLWYAAVVYEVLSLVSLGVFLDRRSNFSRIELLRCILHFAMDWYFLHFANYSMTYYEARWVPERMLTLMYTASIIFWMAYPYLNPDILQWKTDLKKY